jgi:predicted transglutaminase-like cysteine proteinase
LIKKPLKLAVLIAAAAFLSSAPALANSLLFPGYNVSVHPPNTELFIQWSRMLARQKHRLLDTETCSPGFFKTCFEPELEALLAKIQGSEKIKQIESINEWVNYLMYVLDIYNYNVDDYWATKHEFLGDKESGDCEDYAITKYFALKKIGFPADDLWILIARDDNLKIAHAVLLVQFDTTEVILDNRIAILVTNPVRIGLRPIYAINEKGWMRYSAKLRGRK